MSRTRKGFLTRITGMHKGLTPVGCPRPVCSTQALLSVSRGCCWAGWTHQQPPLDSLSPPRHSQAAQRPSSPGELGLGPRSAPAGRKTSGGDRDTSKAKGLKPSSTVKNGALVSYPPTILHHTSHLPVLPPPFLSLDCYGISQCEEGILSKRRDKKGEGTQICLKLENFVKENLFLGSRPIATTTFLAPRPLPIKQQIILIKEKKVKRNLKGCKKPLIISIVA